MRGGFIDEDQRRARAGIIGQRKPIAELSPADWKQTLDINLMGTINTISAGARHLLAQGRGKAGDIEDGDGGHGQV